MAAFFCYDGEWEKAGRSAERKANETLNEVKSAMKVNYFEDKELMKQHINKYKK